MHAVSAVLTGRGSCEIHRTAQNATGGVKAAGATHISGLIGGRRHPPVGERPNPRSLIAQRLTAGGRPAGPVSRCETPQWPGAVGSRSYITGRRPLGLRPGPAVASPMGGAIAAGGRRRKRNRRPVAQWAGGSQMTNLSPVLCACTYFRHAYTPCPITVMQNNVPHWPLIDCE